MRELPMLLNGEMVRATIAGTKTQTRRPVKAPVLQGHPEYLWKIHCEDGIWHFDTTNYPRVAGGFTLRNPLGVPGDLLYVRETWLKQPDPDPELGGFEIRYRATDSVDAEMYGGWRPSIHMPKWAARLWVRNTGVRVERIQDITEEDAEAEGIYNANECHEWWCDGVGFHPDQPCHCGDSSPTEVFAKLWDSIYAKRGMGWDANPWVWVTEYEVAER